MAQMLEFEGPSEPVEASVPPPSIIQLEPKEPRELRESREFREIREIREPRTPSPSTPTHLASVIPSLIALIGRILQELEINLPRLLSLNPSRREAIAHHLERLA